MGVPTKCLIGLIEPDRSVRYTSLVAQAAMDDTQIPFYLDATFPMAANVENALGRTAGSTVDGAPATAEFGETKRCRGLSEYIRLAARTNGQPLACVFTGGGWVAWQGQHRTAHEKLLEIQEICGSASRLIKQGSEASSALLRLTDDPTGIGPGSGRWLDDPSQVVKQVQEKRRAEIVVRTRVQFIQRELAGTEEALAAAQQNTLRRAEWLPGGSVWLTRGDQIVNALGGIAQEAARMNEEIRLAAAGARESLRTSNRRGAGLREEARARAARCHALAYAAVTTLNEIEVDSGLDVYFAQCAALSSYVTSRRLVNDLVSAVERASDSVSTAIRAAERATQAAALALDATIHDPPAPLCDAAQRSRAGGRSDREE